MSTVLITGASKGIGLEFARQYAAKNWVVVATRRKEKEDGLTRLAAERGNVLIKHLDVDDLDSIDRLANQFKGDPVDVLINNAGRMGDGSDPTAQFGEKFGTLKYELMDEYFRTNVRGPIKMLEAFRDSVAASTHKKMVTISSGAGSFGMPGPPGLYWYKASKSAVNMLMQNAARDLKPAGVTVLTFHPGLVLTERLAPMRSKIMKMSGQEKPFEPDEAVAGMIKVISEATIEDTGRFVGNQGQTIPF
ncbi:MAG: SDR family oxidoreductase [Pseudomonadota bacterium]